MRKLWLGLVVSAAVAAFAATAHAADEEEVDFNPEDTCILAMSANCEKWCSEGAGAINYESNEECMRVCRANAATCRSQGMPGF